MPKTKKEEIEITPDNQEFPEAQWTIMFGPRSRSENFTVRGSLSRVKALRDEIIELVNEENAPMEPPPPGDPIMDATAGQQTAVPQGNNCPKCGGATQFRSGTNKSGKDYKGYFCMKQVNPQCDGVKWVR